MSDTLKKQNYLNNKDLLKEIHRSKMSFCYIADPKYDQFDIVVDDVSEINTETRLATAVVDCDLPAIKKRTKPKKSKKAKSVKTDDVVLDEIEEEDEEGGSIEVQLSGVQGEIKPGDWCSGTGVRGFACRVVSFDGTTVTLTHRQDVGRGTELTFRSTFLAAKENRAYRIQNEGYSEAMQSYDSVEYKNKPKQKEFAVELDEIRTEDLVFRVMTYEHIPEEFGRKKNPKNEADEKSKVNFPPFKHYAYQDGKLVEVVRSHWKGNLETGEFDLSRGKITNKLGSMFLKLVERYSHRANWRGYSYVDEMRGQALVQLSAVGLQYNEGKSDNPFAYYTTAVMNSFTRVLNLEKSNQKIRDELLIEHGHLPSYARQMAHEEGVKKLRESADSDSAIGFDMGAHTSYE